ncbi:DeoR/GlpR family DNA-binding transcription regulator [Salinivibrio kushneri]|uniref:DeoR/GlpR family DNA-binding transcription regulator n=1 Tax=Salinivibrio kushneri TaxID=1908198 RepID=UPI000C81B69B|nr:DeoR/GlpR family DNA-binding transcription regulator [Salinivibrio kushneri]
MIPAARHRFILDLLSKHQVLSINELAEKLDVSSMTIRRDIRKLEDKEEVSSVSGGVQLNNNLHNEPSYEIKSTLNSDRKSSIGIAASKFIPKNTSVYLDAGTTSLEIAKQISHRNDLVIITNDFVIASYFSRNSECEIYHTGGRIDKDNQSCVGNKVADFLSGINIDIAFISTSSWSLKGISTPSEQKVVVKQAVSKAAKTNILISDSSKYGRVATFHAIDIESFHTIVTDNAFPNNAVNELEKKGIKVVKDNVEFINKA